VRALGVTSPKPGRASGCARNRRDRPVFESVGSTASRRPKTRARDRRILKQGSGDGVKEPKLLARLAEVGGINRSDDPAEFGKLVAE